MSTAGLVVSMVVGMKLKARVAATTLRTMGWKFVTPPPTVPKCVGLAVPHTSNMDGLLMVLMAQQIGLEMSWMVKDTVDQPVLGSIVRGVGGDIFFFSGNRDDIRQGAPVHLAVRS